MNRFLIVIRDISAIRGLYHALRGLLVLHDFCVEIFLSGQGVLETSGMSGPPSTPMRSRLRAVALLALLASACSGVNTSTFDLIGAPTRPPTDPSQVEILERPPLRPFVRLGRIRAEPYGGADNQAIEQALREQAAKMGANAVVVGFQGERPVGFNIEGLPGDAEARREMGRVVMGTAIAWREGLDRQ